MEVSWRLYLDEVIRRKSAAEKQRIYDAVNVTRTTVQRWRSGENTPDAAHIDLLLNALAPEESERLRSLMLEDPKMRALLPTEAVLIGARPARKIPQDVYEEAFRLGRETTNRFWLLCGTLLLHALTQLETQPTPTGMEIVVARCMPPRHDGKIRSLRADAGRGTPPWRGDFHTEDGFFGIESLAGVAVMNHHGLMVPDLRETEVMALDPLTGHALSAAAFPILREGGVAGVLMVSSCEPNFFTQDRLLLTEKYADVLRLAFYDQEFYPASSIDLALMPSRNRQKDALRSFRQRVNDEYKRALRQGQSFQDLASIETRVRQALEDELLQLASLCEADPGEDSHTHPDRKTLPEKEPPPPDAS